MSEAMTLRDYFAGQALVGVLTLMDKAPPSDHNKIIRGAVISAYLVADAMLLEKDRVR